LYAVGISIYSVVLVACAATPAPGSALPPRWRAAIVFGVSGWIGSALGVGMAQSLHTIPAAFLAAAAAALAAAWLVSRWPLTGRIRNPAAALVATLVAATWVSASPDPGSLSAASRPSPERGRRVYVAEGCINCHSQYVRRRTHDQRIWGPDAVAAGDEEQPPLLGNRRQGPDLRNAGNRRTPAWHRQHLLDPRSLSPASRMPSYGHLFAPGDRRGDDLVAYLASLGADTARRRYEASLATRIPALNVRRPSRGRDLFASWCRQCHGSGGRGDGELRHMSPGTAADLCKGSYWLASWSEDGLELEQGLAQVVRYGVGGTSMPGHEQLRDDQIGDLVAYLTAGDGLCAGARADR
ncbi:MAG: cbb3-type cytochrome c oxidase subunit II, partial [Thermoanaerobaculia bacterium]|nr:cbb3-type cytochrome c oxidase subunit II [Thermoanaerobaculia bacterium]